MRYFLLLAAACAWPVHAATSLPCEGRTTGNGSAEVVCAVAPELASGPLRFSARFSGVHDDSQAGLSATVDAVPLACIRDSTTRIAGEDGGDTLVCRFDLAGDPKQTRRVRVNLLWFHAEPAGVALERE